MLKIGLNSMNTKNHIDMSKKRKLHSSSFGGYFTFSKAQLFNKYVIVTIAFLCWMLFFDKNSFPANYKLGKSVDKLETAKADYEEKIVQARIEKKDIEENKEKYAREKYLMHKDNEDVIVIEKSKK
ncbi:MAG: cell division protein DivIC [Saprospiraceae bacterium]|jgi:hypothetical protein